MFLSVLSVFLCVKNIFKKKLDFSKSFINIEIVNCFLEDEMARIPVRIESVKEEMEFQRFIFARGWRWNNDSLEVEHYFRRDLKLLYFLYTNRKKLTYSNNSYSTEDYENSISVREAKAKLFLPSIIEVDI